ncbi:hypothetical protein [Nonomuraea basaltis]|uniref:hypothetical protein n=1 Tax=Nonomuraea basaltis TaxID=2495887 RepID=UPI00110C44AC|nr:hypothetical protein [Nonomuraea basaltis]TMR97887.1 hypothetical protein EJK15_15385 [Nonomuraea basaltis]
MPPIGVRGPARAGRPGSAGGGERLNRIRAELRAVAQGVVELFHVFDVVSVAGAPWRWRVIDTASHERIAAVRAGQRRVGADKMIFACWQNANLPARAGMLIMVAARGLTDLA